MKTPTPKKTAAGTYRIQFRLNGERVSITAPTAKECRAKALALQAKQTLGEYIAPKTGITLGEAIDQFISDRSAVLSPSTIRNYQGIRDNRFQTVMDKKIKSIENWQAVINEEAKTCSAKTVKNGWALVASVLAVQKFEVPEVVLPQIIKKERQWLDSSQIALLLKTIKEDKNRMFEAAVILGLHSLRLSEILAVDVTDIRDGRIHVEGAVVKGPDGLVRKDTNKNTTSRRTVPILIPRLLEILPKSGPVVQMSEQCMNKHLKLSCAKAKIPAVTMHSLRHSFVALGVEKNIPIDVVQKLGGWKDYQTVKSVYTHISEATVDKYADELKKFFS